MLNKHKGHGYIVVNASVQFTLYAVVRGWATMEAEDGPQKDCEPDDGFSIVFQTEGCEFVNLFRRRCCWGSSTRRTRPTSQTPHVVLTDNCEDRRYLSERLSYHTAGNAITTRSGSVGELSERLTCTLGIHNQRHCR